MNDITIDAWVRLAQELQAKQDYDAMAKALEKCYQALRQIENKEKQTAAIALLDKTFGARDKKQAPGTNQPHRTDAPTPKPKLSRQEQLLEILLHSHNESERARAAKQLSVDAVERALKRPSVTPSQRQQIEVLYRNLERAVLSGDKTKIAAAAKQYVTESITDFVNKIADNRNNQMGITKLGPTTAVILQGALHGALTGTAVQDRKSEMTHEMRETMHQAVNHAYHDVLKSDPNFDHKGYQSLQQELTGSSVGESAVEVENKNERRNSPTPFETKPKPRE